MTVFRAIGGSAILVAGWLISSQAVFAAEDTLAHAKDLYASAAYDEALAVLDKLKTEAAPAETRSIAEYRVFCLLALDRRDEARRNIEAMLQENPQYLPSADQTSPRIQSVFRDVRRQSLPKIVLDRYATAKASFERKDSQAAEQFESLLTLMEDPDLSGVAVLNDLRTVVIAFRDLTKAMAAPVAEPVPQRSAAPAAGQAVPLKSVAPDLASNVVSIYTSADTDVVPPVVQSPNIPPWIPAKADASQDFKGTLEVLIDERGTVMSATMRTSVHPAYNAQLLRAVKSWKFTPARRAGVAVPYLKIVDIHLKPTGS